MSKNPYQSHYRRVSGCRLRRLILFAVSPQLSADRWQHPELLEQLQPDEDIYWADIAATGILGHPRIRSSAFGSFFWDLPITNQRMLAVQLPIVALEQWETYSLPWSDVTRAELRIYTLTNAVTITLEAPSFKKRFKMLYAAFNYAAVTEALRRAVPSANAQSGL